MHNSLDLPSSTRKRRINPALTLTSAVKATLENDDLPPPPWPQLQR